MATAVTPALVTYGQTIVNLTELPMDYSFRVPVTLLDQTLLTHYKDKLMLNDSERQSKLIHMDWTN